MLPRKHSLPAHPIGTEEERALNLTPVMSSITKQGQQVLGIPTELLLF